MDPGRLSHGSCNLLSALQACDACDESPSRLSSNKSCEGETAIVGQECPRLRPFQVGVIQIPMLANERWYQDKEVVRVLLKVREQGAKLKQVVDATTCGRGTCSTSPKSFDAEGQDGGRSSCLYTGIISAEDIIENRLQDRPAKNEAAQSGRRDIMSVEDEKTPCVLAQITNVPRPFPTSVISSWMQNPRTCYCGGRIRPWSPFAPRPCASTSSSLVASSLVATRTCRWTQGLQKDTCTCTGLCVTGQGEVRSRGDCEYLGPAPFHPSSRTH